MATQIATTTPTKAAPTKAAPTKAAPTTVAPTTPAVYKLGKPYNVRPNTAMDNAATWQLVQQAVAQAGGTISQPALVEVLKTRNHAGMLPYALRRGWLQTVKG